MISPSEVRSKHFKNPSSEHYSRTLEVMIDDALKYDPDCNRVRCELVFDYLTTLDINTLSKYISAGYDIIINNESDKNDVTLTVYHYFGKE